MYNVTVGRVRVTIVAAENRKSYIFWGTLLVVLVVEALRYKPEGRGLDSRWCHWNFSLT